MKEDKKEITFQPLANGVLIEWKTTESKLTLPPDVKKEIEMAENGIVKVVEVGPDVKGIKKDDWILLNAPGRLINLNGKTYGLIKSFQADGVYSEKPEFDKIELSVQDVSIKTESTENKVKKFNNKYGIN